MQRGDQVSLLAIIVHGQLGQVPLVDLSRRIDWQPIEIKLALLEQPTAVRRGGPTPYRLLTMFRATLLQDWHRLSFSELSRALCVRLDFQAFAGFEPGLLVPSGSSLCRARKRLERSGARAECCEIILAQLSAIRLKVVPTSGALRDVRILADS